MTSHQTADRRRICEAIPHREPFLFIDEIVEWSEARIVCTKTFTGREEFFAGHYPGHPMVPGVLLCEAAMQAGAILLSRLLAAAEGRVPVATRMNEVRFKRMVRPGEMIRMEVELTERLADAFFLKAKVMVGASGRTLRVCLHGGKGGIGWHALRNEGRGDMRWVARPEERRAWRHALGGTP